MEKYLIYCPNCQLSYDVFDEHSGTQIQCQHCQAYFAIPTRQQAALLASTALTPALIHTAPTPQVSVPKWYKTLTIMGPLCALLLLIGGGVVYWIVNNKKVIKNTEKYHVEIAQNPPTPPKPDPEPIIDPNIQIGETWVTASESAAKNNDYFLAAMLAARAIGYDGFGRAEAIAEQPDFAFNYPAYINTENSNLRLIEIQNLINNYQKNYFPNIWSSSANGNHRSHISSVKISPDSKYIVSGSYDRTIQLWDLKKGNRVGSPWMHNGLVTEVCFSPDSKLVASSCRRSRARVQLWDVQTGLPHKIQWNAPDSIDCLCFSPDGKYLITGSSDNHLYLIDVKTMKSLGIPWKGHTKGVEHVIYSPDGKHVASGSRIGKVIIWNAQTGKPMRTLLKKHSRSTEVQFSPDGKRLLTTSAGLICLWETSNWSLINSWEINNKWGPSACFTPDNNNVVYSNEKNNILFRSAISGELEAKVWKGAKDSVDSLCFSPDGNFLVAWEGQFHSSDFSIRIWDAKIGKPIGKATASHTGSVASLAFNSKVAQLVSGGDDGKIIFWDTKKLAPIDEPLKVSEHGVRDISFSPDCQYLATGVWSSSTNENDSILHIWNTKNRTLINSSVNFPNTWLSSLSYSPDGEQLILGMGNGTKGILQVNTNNWQPVGDIWNDKPRSPLQTIFCLACSPDGKRLITNGFGDNSLLLWNTSNHSKIGQPLFGHSKRVTSVAYSPDGKYVISGSRDKNLILWNADTAQMIGKVWSGHTRGITSVAFSPNSKRVISSSYDGTIRLWDVATGKTIGAPFKSHATPNRNPLRIVKFSPDGNFVASGGSDQTIKFWDVSKNPYKQLAPYLTKGYVSFDNRNLIWHTSELNDSLLTTPSNFPILKDIHQ